MENKTLFILKTSVPGEDSTHGTEFKELHLRYSHLREVQADQMKRFLDEAGVKDYRKHTTIVAYRILIYGVRISTFRPPLWRKPRSKSWHKLKAELG